MMRRAGILLIWIVAMGVFFLPAFTWAEEPTGKDQASLESIVTELEQLRSELAAIKQAAQIRDQLESTSEEKTEESERILTAVGQEYVLRREGSLGVTYGASYSYNSSDVLENAKTQLTVDHTSNHSLSNSVSVQYGLRNYLTVNGSIPFLYKWDQQSTSSERNATDIGDISFGCQWQPVPTSTGKASYIVNTSLIIPSGTSPYKIDVDDALSTGSGFYSALAELSISKPIDPIMAFGSLSYRYTHEITGLNQVRNGPNDASALKEVSPGDTIGGSMGIAYALSYQVTLHLSCQYSHTTSYEFDWHGGESNKTGSSTAASMNIGTGWKLSPESSMNITLGVGLTDATSDFTLSFSMPFNFTM
ncbi:hypothetical protein [Desulfoluna sp.]|uniref:hypothetical protein n=1 Tax=Desulfoluna sp. TaxID=2045199 RepID=UPI0026363502|nr:hypothetical protein [Desulfoluna sp.]